MGWFRRSEQRSLPPPENEIPLWGAYSASEPPAFTNFTGSLTPLQALGIGDVWAAVRCLADAASSLPVHVYRTRPDGARERVTGGALVDLLNRPAPSTTQSDLVSTMIAHLLIWGCCYLAKYSQGGRIVQLNTLVPDRVRPELQGGRVRFRYGPPTGSQRLLDERDVVYIKGLSIDGYRGMSAVAQAGRVLGLSDHLVRHALGFFRTGPGLPAAVLKLPPGASSRQVNLASEQIQNDLRRYGVLVIEGEGDFQPLTLKLDDAQFAEQRRLSAQEVARVFRLPPHMLGAPTGDSMTYSTIEQQSIDFVRYSLQPWLRRIELAISNDRDLAFERQYVKLEVDGLLRGDAKTRADYYSTMITAGVLTVDECRELEDLPPRREPPPTPRVVMPAGTQLPAQLPAQPQGVSTNGSSN